MSLHIFFRFISFFLIVSAASRADAQSMAKPNCPSKCGNVNISYPFGIGADCYYDEWYEIACKDILNLKKPFLRKFDMEVLSIEVEREKSIAIYSPVVSNCPGHKGNNTIWTSANLSGSPYSFSSVNILTVVGCANALVFNSTNAIISGCTTKCNSDNISTIGCFGINCCETYIRTYNYLTSYTISVEENTTIGCTYAFLGNLDLSPEDDYYSALRFINNTKQVRVVMDWGVNMSSNKNCYHSRYNQDVYYSQCSCPWDHVGNPYIPDGCKMVEACANCEGDCHIKYDHARGSHFYYCRHTTKKILGASFGGGLLFLLLCGLCFWLYKLVKQRKMMNLKKKFFKRNGGLLLEQQLSSNEGTVEKTIIFTSDELEKATDNYNENRVLGHGGQGTIYKGMLTDGKITAIKKSKVVDESQLGQFINEVVILSQINHRNIVKLLGCCLETEVPLLVYEFVLNGNLFDLIHNKNEELPLSWKMRLQIATEVAGALAYLHSASSIPIYHRDVKSTNILLDEKFRAKVSDFGTSRSITIEQTHLTTIVYGTFGYLDPEYFQSSQFTDKSDVYSFGVVLVELLTGQQPISSFESEEGRSLATRFILYMEQMRLFDMVDSRVLEEAPKEEIIAVSEIARRCLNLNGKKRPTMKEVVMDLEVISRAPSSHATISLNHDTFNIKKNKNHLDDGYSTPTMIMSDYRAFSSSDVEPLVFYTQ